MATTNNTTEITSASRRKTQPLSVQDILDKLPDARRSGRDYRASCPAHGGDNPTTLKLTEGENGRAVLYCHAHHCSHEDILRALGLWQESWTSPTDKRTGYTPTPKPVKLSEDEKIIMTLAGKEALALIVGPLPERPTDPEVIAPYSVILEELWETYTATSDHEAVKARYIELRPSMAVGMPKFLRALDRRLADRLGQPLPAIIGNEPPKCQAPHPSIQHADEIEAQPMEWLWYPYIPRSMLTMVDGDPGIGKSMMLLQVATNLSRGYPFLDQMGKPTLAADVDGPQTTLILSAEDSLPHVMIPRLQRAGADLSHIKFLTGWVSADGLEQAFDLQHLAMLIEAIQEIKPVLVILDPLVAYLGDIDMHRSNQTRPLMAALKKVAEQYGCTIMGVRHPSKLDLGGPLMYRGQGNMDIIGSARSGVWVQKHPSHPETQSLMIHSKTNIGMAGRTVIFSREDGAFAWKGVSRLTEAMFTGKGPEPYAFLEAFFWLEETMKPGHPYESASIEKEADARDISQKVLKRAKKMLGITAREIGSRWYVTLPALPSSKTIRTTGDTGTTGTTGTTGYCEPISMGYDEQEAEVRENPVDPVVPEYPVVPVVIRGREDVLLMPEKSIISEPCVCGYPLAIIQLVCPRCGTKRPSRATA